MKPLARIQSHTALRGVAALSVVGYHLQFGTSYRLPIETATPFLGRSYLFVDLFFILSGFIIAYVNRADDRAAAGRIAAGPFLLARFVRLYPLHFVCLIFLVLTILTQRQIMLATGHVSNYPTDAHALVSLLTQLLLLNAWYPPEPNWNIANWSISAEFVAYALFPALVAFRFAARRMATALLILVPLAFFATIFATTGSLDIIQGWAPLRCIAGFLLGMLLFYWRDVVDRVSTVALSVLQVAAVVASVAVVATAVPDPLVVVPFMLLVWSSWTDRGLLGWLLDRQVFLKLGDWSYSVYLAHIPLLTMLGFFWQRAAQRLPLSVESARAIYLGLAYVLVIGVSALSFRYVEVPARHWLARQLLKRGTSPVPTAPAAP